MQRLDALIARGERHCALVADEAEVARQLQICNACRYCEGFCAVFPAMTRRLEFGKADVHYLANLCHNCGACLHACQYAPPHEFAVNVPRAMARVRGQTYVDYAWPRAFGALYERNGLTLALALAAGSPCSSLLAVATHGASSSARAAGRQLLRRLSAQPAGVDCSAPSFVFALLALGIGVTRFWRDIVGRRAPRRRRVGEAAATTCSRLKLPRRRPRRGCNDEDDAFTLRRRRFHHLTFYGFLLCFAATCVATLYHYLLGLARALPLLSCRCVLGTVGGIGCSSARRACSWLHLRRDPQHRRRRAERRWTAASSPCCSSPARPDSRCWRWRDSGAMPLLLAVHLGVVMALFLTLPYGKFAHGVFRSAALLKWAIERRPPSRLQLGED